MFDGHSQFNDLLFHRGEPRFFAFDLLWVDGEDLRTVSLIERKRVLRQLVGTRSPYLLYSDYLEAEGEQLFKLVCEKDLEGVVAKHRQSLYTTGNGNPAWVKIKNPNYSQAIGREELFSETNHGWNVCTKAAAAV